MNIWSPTRTRDERGKSVDVEYTVVHLEVELEFVEFEVVEVEHSHPLYPPMLPLALPPGQRLGPLPPQALG